MKGIERKVCATYFICNDKYDFENKMDSARLNVGDQFWLFINIVIHYIGLFTRVSYWFYKYIRILVFCMTKLTLERAV